MHITNRHRKTYYNKGPLTYTPIKERLHLDVLENSSGHSLNLCSCLFFLSVENMCFAFHFDIINVPKQGK